MREASTKIPGRWQLAAHEILGNFREIGAALAAWLEISGILAFLRCTSR
jgi:hypothetical protein